MMLRFGQFGPGVHSTVAAGAGVADRLLLVVAGFGVAVEPLNVSPKVAPAPDSQREQAYGADSDR
jgi:hypothetical protein